MTDATLIANPAKRKLAAGEPVVMMSLRQLRTADAAMIIRECGFDGFYVDREHGMFSDAETATLCASGQLMGLLPAVRVRANTTAEIGGALDAGALCVIVPHVTGKADAAKAVQAVKFPPQGARSIAALSPTTRYRTLPAAELIRLVNDMTMVIAMLETADGISAADEIASVQGIDALMIGPGDLSAELGIPGDVRHPRIREAYVAAAKAARAHGKHFVAGGAGGPDAGEMAAHGAKIFMGGTDIGYMMSAARTAASTLRKQGSHQV
jgi:2-keto-3-deoxy-L-rhamnonate aldolase RhmA